MSTIKEDAYGIYVKSGGWIARPRYNSYYTPNMPTSFTGVASPDSTKFKVGDKVKTYHHGGSVTHTVKSDTHKEKWESRSGQGLEYDYAIKMFKDKCGDEWETHFNDYVRGTEEWDKVKFNSEEYKKHHELKQQIKDYIQVNYYDRLSAKHS